MKKVILSVLGSLILTTCALSQDPTQSMHDAFAKGFQATKARNRQEAVQWFQRAGQFAVQAREWKGCLDAGNALLKLGEPAQATGLFDQAFQIAQQQKDWRISVASGYAFASLPPDLNKKPDATRAFMMAADEAKRKGDWMGLSEAANGLIHLGENAQAQGVTHEAKIIVDVTKSVKGAQVVAELYERLGQPNEAQAMKLARENYIKLQEGANPGAVQPPPGWSPVGESVAGPPVPSIEQQRAARASADKDIEAKNQWILQQKQLEFEREKLANEYSGYYYYPYGYSSYSTYQPWGWDLLIPWADHYAGYYAYSDGYYHYHGDYSGFGFSYGYADGSSFFGISLHVHD